MKRKGGRTTELECGRSERDVGFAARTRRQYFVWVRSYELGARQCPFGLVSTRTYEYVRHVTLVVTTRYVTSHPVLNCRRRVAAKAVMDAMLTGQQTEEFSDEDIANEVVTLLFAVSFDFRRSFVMANLFVLPANRFFSLFDRSCFDVWLWTSIIAGHGDQFSHHLFYPDDVGQAS